MILPGGAGSGPKTSADFTNPLTWTSASRVEERDFALLLEGPANSDQANARAQQVVASGLRPSQALPPELTLRLQVVVAMLPGQQPDAAATLQWTLAAAASVKPDSRKQIRML